MRRVVMRCGGAGASAARVYQNPWRAMPTMILGILTFFLLEKLVLWRHCHDAHECEVHTSSAASPTGRSSPPPCNIRE